MATELQGESVLNCTRLPWGVPRLIELPADEAAATIAEEMRADPNGASAVREAHEAAQGKCAHGADVLPFKRPPTTAPPQGLSGAAHAQSSAADRNPAASSHRQLTFDNIVQENLRRGLLLTQRDVLINAIRDLRLSQRHRLTLASLIEHTNAKSGMAYPGWRALAEATTWYDYE